MRVRFIYLSNMNGSNIFHQLLGVTYSLTDRLPHFIMVLKYLRSERGSIINKKW